MVKNVTMPIWKGRAYLTDNLSFFVILSCNKCNILASFFVNSIVCLILCFIVLCSNRVSQMTKTYDDIEAVTRLLEEVIPKKKFLITQKGQQVINC